MQFKFRSDEASGPTATVNARGRRFAAGSSGIAAIALWVATMIGGCDGRTLPESQPSATNGPHELQELAARMQQAVYGERYSPTQDDGWDELTELFAAYETFAAKHDDPPVKTREEVRIVIWPGLVYDSPTDAALTPEQNAVTLKRTLAALAELREQGEDGLYGRWKQLRSRFRFVVPVQEGPMVEWELPELASTRRLARLGAARLHQAAERGDWPGIVDAYEDLLVLSRGASARPAGLSGLVAVAVNALTQKELREALARATRPADASTLRALMAAMDRQLPTPGPKWVFEGERIAAINSLDAALRKSSGGKQAKPEVREEVRSKAEEFYAEAIAIADLPRTDRIPRINAAEAILGGKDLASVALSVIASPIGRTLDAFDMSKLETDATRTLLAIMLFEAQTGKLPESLAALVPTYLAQLPTDPWSPDGLVYRSLPAPDELGRRFVLYSKGADGEDNAGRVDTTGKSTPFVAAGRGFDAMYTPGGSATAP